MLRNLFYGVWAVKYSDEWLKNLTTLFEYAHLFNGRKIVVVRSDEKSVAPEIVEQKFRDVFQDVEFIHRRNDPELGEVEGFVEDFSRLYSLREDEITFYAHTKGVSYYAQGESRLVQAVRAWREMMYYHCLSDIDRVEEVLKRYACAGCFKNWMPAEARWHYAGNFWWVNHKRLFETDWKNIRYDYYGVEMYLGLIFSKEEAYALAFEGPFKKNAFGNLYGPNAQVCRNCWHTETSICSWRKGTNPCPRCGHAMMLQEASDVRKVRELRGWDRYSKWTDRARQ